MKKILIIIIALAGTFAGYGQDAFSSYRSIATKVDQDNRLYGNSAVAGSPYYSDEYSETVFYTNDQGELKADARLDLLHNTFEFLVHDQRVTVIKNTIDSVHYRGDTYIFKDIYVKNKVEAYPVLLLAKRQAYGLYYLQLKEFKEAVKAEGYVEPKPARIEDMVPMYILSVEEKNIPLSSWNSLYKELPEHKAALKKFIKKNKVKFKDRDSMIAFLYYLSEV